MSRAFVKEQDGNLAEDDVPDRPQSAGPNYVTPQGMADLRARHHVLVDRHAVLKAADGDDARSQQELREVERELNFLVGRLDRAIVVDPAAQPPGEVRFGAHVDVRDDSGQTHHFVIVGEDEADVTHGRVSWASPLAKAMMGAQVGDVVEWSRPAGVSRLQITSIGYGVSA